MPQKSTSTAAHSDWNMMANAGVPNRGWISATLRKNTPSAAIA